MYSGLDRVELFGIESDVKPEKITAAFDSASTDDIAVTSVGIFTAFENYPVDATNPGYVKLGTKKLLSILGFLLQIHQSLEFQEQLMIPSLEIIIQMIFCLSMN